MLGDGDQLGPLRDIAAREADGLRRRLQMYHAFAMIRAPQHRPERGMIPRRVLLPTAAAVAFAVGFIVEGERALVERCRSEVAVCPVVTLEAPERRGETIPATRETPPRRPQESSDRPGRVPEGQ
jgi:hypothetical protein